MAKAKLVEREIKPAVPAVTEEVVTLDMSRKEAKELLDSLGPLCTSSDVYHQVHVALYGRGFDF